MQTSSLFFQFHQLSVILLLTYVCQYPEHFSSNLKTPRDLREFPFPPHMLASPGCLLSCGEKVKNKDMDNIRAALFQQLFLLQVFCSSTGSSLPWILHQVQKDEEFSQILELKKWCKIAYLSLSRCELKQMLCMKPDEHMMYQYDKTLHWLIWL